MNEREYHAARALSKSGIDLLLDCPARYKAWLDGEDERTETPALKFGTLAHLLTLEPQRFNELYCLTDTSGATKEGKALRASLPDGVTVINSKEYEAAQMLADAVRSHPQAKHLFKRYDAEVSLFWQNDGVQCKGRADIIADIDGLTFLADVKTTETASPEHIRRSIEKYGYHRQAAWYLDGMRRLGTECAGFVFIFVEKTPPHLVTVVQLDDEALAIGMDECLHALEVYKQCMQSGIWPCYTRNIETIGLSKWYTPHGAPAQAQQGV